ncbi:actinia tenebrosa protease inhibitors-like [Gastrophryne carolinensis]
MASSIIRCLLPLCLLGYIAASSEPAPPSNITVCLLPREEGDCRALLPHYYYDRYTQTCEEFLYGGCGGSSNNFETLEDCEKTCWKIKRVPKPCRMEVEPGPCRGYIKRYAYNMLTMKCDKFYYGGCYGNDNNFQDEASCLEKCSPKRKVGDICHLPKEIGPCSTTVLRYYYSSEEKRCLLFFYGGCSGNDNNFISKHACEEACATREDIQTNEKTESKLSSGSQGTGADGNTQKVDNKVNHKPVYLEPGQNGAHTQESGDAATICQLPLEEGLCDNDVLRYRYNSSENKCQIFHYRGCFGNANNFMTKLECEKTCMKPERKDLSDYGRSYAFKHALLDLHHQNGLPEHCNVSTCWNFTLHMLDHLYHQSKSVNDFFMQQMASFSSQCDFQLWHWQMIRDMCRVLRPFEEVTRFDNSGMNDVMPLI